MAECMRCLGCKQIADCESGEPWSDWAALPPGSDLAVRAGIVKPIQCPACKGTGEEPAKLLSLEGEKRKRSEAAEGPVERMARQYARAATDEFEKIDAEKVALKALAIPSAVGMAMPAYDPEFSAKCNRWQLRQNNRTVYAARAMQGLLASNAVLHGTPKSIALASHAFDIAEAMLAEDERRQEPFPTFNPGYGKDDNSPSGVATSSP